MIALHQQHPHTPVVWRCVLAMLVAGTAIVVSPRVLAADPPSEQVLKGAITKTTPGDGSVRNQLPAVQAPVQGTNQRKGDGGNGALIGLLRPVGTEGAKQVNGDGVAQPKSTP